MSEIEKIGQALFGQSWMAQIAANLNNENGEPISRQTVQTWHNRDKLPVWAKQALKILANQRFHEIAALNEAFGNIEPSIDDAIEHFIAWNGQALSPASIVFCRLRFGNDRYSNEIHQADITLDEKTGEGWQKLTFSEKFWQRELLKIRSELKSKLQPIMAVHDPALDTHNSVF